MHRVLIHHYAGKQIKLFSRSNLGQIRLNLPAIATVSRRLVLRLNLQMILLNGRLQCLIVATRIWLLASQHELVELCLNHLCLWYVGQAQRTCCP